jgi:hypothetical protein
MNITTATAKRSDCKKYASHSTTEITGYVVVRTVVGFVGRDSHGRGRGDVLAIVDGGSRYLEALNIAKAARVNGDWAIVRDLHGCPVCDPIVKLGQDAHTELAL